MLTNILLALLFAGCASTTFYRDGKPVAKFQGDMVGVKYEAPGVSFTADAISHSTATRAGGEAGRVVIDSVGRAAVGIGTSIIPAKVIPR